MGVRTKNLPFAHVSCAARIARARCRHIRSPFLYGKIPRRGNNHPCGKPSRPRTRTFPRPCAHNAPEAAQNAPRSRRARQTARSPTPKGSPHRAAGAESSKIGNGSSPGGSRKRGAGRRRRVEQSLFFLGKNLEQRTLPGLGNAIVCKRQLDMVVSRSRAPCAVQPIPGW